MGKLSRKDLDKELAKLHVELVEPQQRAIQRGPKVCIVSEARDGAGKGGAIDAITERVGPRPFRVVVPPTSITHTEPSAPAAEETPPSGGDPEPRPPSGPPRLTRVK